MGNYFIYSTTLKAHHIKRKKQNKVFKEMVRNPDYLQISLMILSYIWLLMIKKREDYSL